MLIRRLPVAVTLVAVTVLAREARCAEKSGEVLYNGIRLPSPWPPEQISLTRDKPMPVPYLTPPPEAIPIDVGRQLFVDDFLIERTTLRRAFHKATLHPASPVLRPDVSWERKGHHDKPEGTAAAMVFSGGVFFDPEDALFKAWYMSGYCLNLGLAVSRDGVHWGKPLHDVVPGTNVVSPGLCDTSVFWLDTETKDRRQRFKMWREEPRKRGLGLFYSADGIHWGQAVARTGRTPSPSTVFWNPFRKVWVYSARSSAVSLGRYRRYWETPDAAANIGWDDFRRPEVGPKVGKDPMRLPLWVCADTRDLPFPGADTPPEIYNLDAVGYESVMLGLFSMLRGFPPGRPKVKEIVAGFSRDGFHWDRPFREPIIEVSRDVGAWNAGNMQSAGGCCLVVGDELYFYVSGRRLADPPKGAESKEVCSTGLAVLRRDGFASMDAGGKEGVLTTRPVTFRGKYLFVNVDADAGELRAELLDKAGNVLPGLGRAQCQPVRVDKTLVQVQWQGGADLSALAGRPVRLRFTLRGGRLYSFWVSPDRSGASYGYVGAGGPGFPGSRDTVGLGAYRAAQDLKN